MTTMAHDFRPQLGDRIEVTDLTTLRRHVGEVVEIRPMFTQLFHKPTGTVAAKIRDDDGREHLSAQRWSEKFLVWTDAHGARYVPMTAPDRIVALATTRYGAGAKITTVLPDGALSWHPSID